MISFHVYLDSNCPHVKDCVDKTIEKMNAHQSEFRLIDKSSFVINQEVCDCIKNSEVFATNDTPTEDSFESNSVNNDVFWDTFFLTGVKNILSNTKTPYIIITDKRFKNNWFAHAKDNFRVISVGGLDKYISVRLENYLIMLIAKFFAWYSARLTSMDIYDHFNHINRPESCFFDAGQYSKYSIIFAIRSNICRVCECKLLENGISIKQLNAIKILLKLMRGRTFDKVFIVHGHEGKDTVARYIESLNIKAIILSEQPSRGCTIIEKLEMYSDVDFAIILYTPDDIGGVKNTPYIRLRPRARQNVIFEHGYFSAKLGRENVIVLLKNNTERTKLEFAGDNDGIVYVPFDKYGGWKNEIRRALRLSGYIV